MGTVIKGPFDLKYGLTTLAGIESVDISYEVDSDDKTTVQGRKRTIYGAHKVTAKAKFLESDVPSLAVVLPQYYVANGGVLATGETVNDPQGAIDVVPGGCAAASTTAGLVISSCGSAGQIMRIVDCATELTGVTMDDKDRTVEVTFTGFSDDSTIQFFKKGAVASIS